MARCPWFPAALLVGGVSGLPALSGAQLVRGTATERGSGIAVPGVLVTLERAEGDTSTSLSQRSVLTGDGGTFALRAPAPGRYRLSAKRIGAQRFFSDTFSLAIGETRVIDVALEVVVHTLEEVVVAGESMCVLHEAETGRVAAMWDDIRTALSATTISSRDTLITGRASRYARLLDPASLRVLREASAEAQGLIDRPFASPSGDSLSAHGWWGEITGDTITFFGPDTEVLLSPAFRRDHCFFVGSGRRDRPGLLGLAFEPAPDRRVNDIRGTLWMDQASRELRLVEFRYTGLASIPHVERIGGEVHFARMANGAWVVRRWHIRMPRFGFANFARGSTRTWSAQGFQLPRIAQILEEGGEFGDERLPAAMRVAVTGTVRDSTGRPLAGATVRLVGTERAATADSAGSFRLEGLSRGFYVVTAEHPGYAALGTPAAEAELVADTGAAAPPALALRAFDTNALVQRMCDGRVPDEGRLAARVTLIDSTAGTPLANAAVRLTWSEYANAQAGGLIVRRLVPYAVNGTTDDRGGVTFCGLPPGVALELGVPLGEDRQRRITTLRLDGRRAQSVTVRSARTP